MIIRSQDKKIIFNFNQAECFRLGNRINGICDVVVCYPIVSENDRGFVSLGEYSTEEKAIKVLDAICNNYQDCKMSESGLRQLAKVEFVFQMPQDYEV